MCEIYEAFAAVVLQTEHALGIDPERVDVNGGATLLGTALDELNRSGKATVLVTMCIDGRHGIATVPERT